MPLSVPPSQCVSYCPLSVDALSSHSVYLKQYCLAAISKTTFFSVYTPDLRFISLAPTFQLSLGRFFLQLCFLSCSMHLSVSSKSCLSFLLHFSMSLCLSWSTLSSAFSLSLPFFKNVFCLSFKHDLSFCLTASHFPSVPRCLWCIPSLLCLSVLLTLS